MLNYYKEHINYSLKSNLFMFRCIGTFKLSSNLANFFIDYVNVIEINYSELKKVLKTNFF